MITGGLRYHPLALGLLLQERRYWPLIWTPVALNMLVGGLLYAGLVWAGWGLVDRLVAGLPAWAALVGPLLHVVLVVVLLIVTGLLVARFGVVLGAPWYGRLAEAIEREHAPEFPAPAGGALAEVRRALAHEGKKLVLTLSVLLPLFAIGIVPGIGTAIATAGGLLLGWTIVCLDFLDPSLARRGLGFRAKLGVIYRNWPDTAGFGALSLLLVSIPLVNLLTVPLSMAAGALLFSERLSRKINHGSSTN